MQMHAAKINRRKGAITYEIKTSQVRNIFFSVIAKIMVNKRNIFGSTYDTFDQTWPKHPY